MLHSGMIKQLLKWIEQKFWTGEVVQDYGNIVDDSSGAARVRIGILLCRQKGKLQLIFRRSETAVFGGSVSYMKLAVTPATLERLAEIVVDARQRMDGGRVPEVVSAIERNR